MHKIKLTVVDDHAMVATGLATELSGQQDFQVISVITQPVDLLDSISKNTPDAILMDIRMGIFNGIQLTEKIKEVYPEVKVILMSGYRMGQLAQSSKADAFASKEEPIEVLASTIRKVCLESATVFPMSNAYEEKLTDAEMKVLSLLGEDMTRKEIAATLYCSEKTIANHMTVILRKLKYVPELVLC